MLPNSFENELRQKFAECAATVFLIVVPWFLLTSADTCADTPGVHLQHSLQHLLPPQHFKELLPRGRLKPYCPQSPKDLALEQQITSQSSTTYGIPEVSLWSQEDETAEISWRAWWCSGAYAAQQHDRDWQQ